MLAIDLCMAISNSEGPVEACFLGRRSEGNANGLLVPVACAVNGLVSCAEGERGADVDLGMDENAFSEGLRKGRPVF